jgi:hypothetical protein
MGGDKFAGFIIIKNFCNLLNDEWCVLREAGFPGSQPIVDMEISDDGSAYIFEEFIDPPGQGRVSDPSLWEIRLGVTCRFVPYPGDKQAGIRPVSLTRNNLRSE